MAFAFLIIGSFKDSVISWPGHKLAHSFVPVVSRFLNLPMFHEEGTILSDHFGLCVHCPPNDSSLD